MYPLSESASPRLISKKKRHGERHGEGSEEEPEVSLLPADFIEVLQAFLGQLTGQSAAVA